MGMLFRMFAPKPLKKVRRIAHPVSLLTPRPVKRAKMAAIDIANPVGGAKRAAERAAVRSVRGSRGSPPRANTASNKRQHETSAMQVTPSASTFFAQSRPRFALWDGARLIAKHDYESGTTSEQKLRATLMVTNVWVWQVDEAEEIIAETRRLPADHPERQPTIDVMNAWLTEADDLSIWRDRQDLLVQSVGSTRAQEIGDTLVPDVEAIRQLAQEQH